MLSRLIKINLIIYAILRDVLCLKSQFDSVEQLTMRFEKTNVTRKKPSNLSSLVQQVLFYLCNI